MLINMKKDKGPRDAAPDKNRAEMLLSDDDLDVVTGGTGHGYSYWFPDGSSSDTACLDGGAHEWVKSPGGNFEYCSKCHAERYK